jgi:uncharacterized protein (DUF2236 family)
MVERIRAVHDRVRGTAPDGRAYAASDPHLLRWVHIAEVDSFLSAHQRFGHAPLDAAGRDRYLAETAQVAEALGALDPPRTERELRRQLDDYRSELWGTPAAREAARFILLTPPLPPLARVPYAAISAAAVQLLPAWARRELRLPWVPMVGDAVAGPSGALVTRSIRWAMAPPE